MFNKTLQRIARKVRRNLFNPDQSGSPQLWHVPKGNVYGVVSTPDVAKIPRVVFTLGTLEPGPENQLQAFDNQPELKTVTEEIHPPEHDFAQTYTLQNKPIKPIIKALAYKTDGTGTDLSETDDFLVDYNKGEITLREDMHDITTLEITYRTGEIIGPGAFIHLTQCFSIEVEGKNVMNTEAITAIIIGVIEAFKEEILAKPDKTIDGLNVISYLNPMDIQLVNKAEEVPAAGSNSVKLDYQVPGMIRIARKVPGEKPGIIEKIFHPEVVESEHDVEVEVDITNEHQGPV
jgi:hypothetical protein